MIDLHCHILPDLDDGPRRVEDAVSMARAHVAVGVDTVVATPHVDEAFPLIDADVISLAADELRADLSAADIPLTILTGAELSLSAAVALDDAELRRHGLGGGPWLLIEAPLGRPRDVEPAMHELMERGYLVMVAHPERSPTFQHDIAALHRLVERGALTQVTAGALVGRFGRTVQQFSERLMRERLVHAVASDAHDMFNRSPGIAWAIDGAGLGSWGDWLSTEVPAAVIAGAPIPPAPSGRPGARGRRGTFLARFGSAR
jgi:protein-tyrosine phosphatase